jgi:uracil-DNA glycosylase
MWIDLPACWKHALAPALAAPSFERLAEFVDSEREAHLVFPPADSVFAAFRKTLLEDVRVVVLGQDPYHDDGQAHGLAFSVPGGQRIPPSLRNIYKELNHDLGVVMPPSGDLTSWAAQGVLLLNTVLTVRAHTPASHAGRGWESFTDEVVRVLAGRHAPVVFVLWGASAKRKQSWISSPHLAICSAHPSPLSASRGFFGSKPFSAVNRALEGFGTRPIEWSPGAAI